MQSENQTGISLCICTQHQLLENFIWKDALTKFGNFHSVSLWHKQAKEYFEQQQQKQLQKPVLTLYRKPNWFRLPFITVFHKP